MFELKRVDLLRLGDIYGLKVYTSILSANFETGARKEKGDPKEARWVYNFKKFGKCADEVRLMVSVLAAHLGCLDIVAVPGSGTEANQLQKLFGTKIERIKEVQTRKNRHKEPLPDDYEDSYVIHTEEIRGEKILVVDDITTTGTTLNHFADSLGKIGYEVIKAAIGLDYKLDIQEGEPLYVYIEPAKTRKSFGTIDVGVRYGPPCKICSHPQAQEFNRGLILGKISLSEVALIVGCHVSSVSRHLKKHVEPSLAKQIRDDDALGDIDILGELRELYLETKAMRSAAEDNWHIRRAFHSEARENLQLMAKLRGELQEGATVNILLSPQWAEIRMALMSALQPFPEARAAVAQTLLRMNDGEETWIRSCDGARPDDFDESSRANSRPMASELITSASEADIDVL